MFKDFLKVSTYQLIYFLVKFTPFRKREKTLLLVKTDELGDYILFRSVLRHIRTSQKYKEHNIILVANSISRQLFECVDKDTVNEVIWVNKKKFIRSFSYRFKILRNIRKTGATELVNFIHSGIFRFDGVIAAVTPADSKISMVRDSFVYSRYEQLLEPSNLYTREIDTGNEDLFELYRNYRFLRSIIEHDPGPASIRLPIKGSVSKYNLPEKYFVIFPGSGIKAKKWDTVNFVAVAEHIFARTGSIPVICGSESDRVDCEAFSSKYPLGKIDLTGKTSLAEFALVLKGAVCIVSVDTGAVHLAAAVGCNVFALFSGLHYGRFAPYPTEIAPGFVAIYPDEIEEQLEKGRLKKEFQIPIDLIKSIPASKVIEKIEQHLGRLQAVEPG